MNEPKQGSPEWVKAELDSILATASGPAHEQFLRDKFLSENAETIEHWNTHEAWKRGATFGRGPSAELMKGYLKGHWDMEPAGKNPSIPMGNGSVQKPA